MVVDSSEPWLGASPDSIISVKVEKHLVEIKFPYAARDVTVQEVVSSVKAFCLLKEGDELILGKSQKYLYQVQVQLHVCKV